MNLSTAFGLNDSLRLRLLAGTLASVAVIWIALSLFAWRGARHEADELFDAHLAQTAALLSILVSDRGDDEEIEEHLPAHHYARKVAFQVWAKDNRLVAHSAMAPDERLSSAQDEGFSDTNSGGRQWRVYGLRDAGTHYLIQVGEAREARQAVGRELASRLLLPVVVALPLLALALIVLIRASLSPLLRLADLIGQRSPDRLDAIALAGTPRELHPILDRLNGLLSRIGHSLDQERRFTADAAHELRTPLAAMRTHAQVARASLDDGERDAALASVIEATDRAAHLVNQLLTLARLDATRSAGAFVVCDLRNVTVEAMALVAPQALAKDIELELREDLPVRIAGEPTLLAVLLRNLLDNAVRYGPPGSSVRVGVGTRADGNAYLEVADSGPGIPAGERAHVLGRFYRIAGSGEVGSGLGLSIVERIAELHGARLELGDNPGAPGLCARVLFRAS